MKTRRISNTFNAHTIKSRHGRADTQVARRSNKSPDLSGGGFCVLFQPSRTRVTWKRPSIWRIHSDVTLDINRRWNYVNTSWTETYQIKMSCIHDNTSRKSWQHVTKSLFSWQHVMKYMQNVIKNTTLCYEINKITTSCWNFHNVCYQLIENAFGVSKIDLSCLEIRILTAAKTIQQWLHIPFSGFQQLRPLLQHNSNWIRRRPTNILEERWDEIAAFACSMKGLTVEQWKLSNAQSGIIGPHKRNFGIRLLPLKRGT